MMISTRHTPSHVHSLPMDGISEHGVVIGLSGMTWCTVMLWHRVFDFFTGKLHRKYDETLKALIESQKVSVLEHSMTFRMKLSRMYVE